MGNCPVAVIPPPNNRFAITYYINIL